MIALNIAHLPIGIDNKFDYVAELAKDYLTDEEPVWVEDVANDVQFTVYDTENGTRELYLIAVDWYRDPAVIRRATVRVGEHRYGVEMPFGVMIKCVTRDGILAYPHTEDGEVLAIDGNTVRVQGVGKVDFTFAKDGTAKTVTLDFTNDPVQEISV